MLCVKHKKLYLNNPAYIIINVFGDKDNDQGKQQSTKDKLF